MYIAYSKLLSDRVVLMKLKTKFTFVALGITVLGLGCTITEDKIELWKSTQNGPQKIAEVLSDSEASIDLRSAAAVALIEIKQHALLTEAFEKLSQNESDAVIKATVPILAPLSQGSPDSPADLTSDQIAAKDGLFLLYDFTGPQSRTLIKEALVKWCTEGDFASRARAGFNIRVIIKKVGKPMYSALTNELQITQNSIEPIAKLLRDSEDKDVLQEASTKISQELKKNMGKFSKVHLRAAAIIGGAPVGDFLISIAVDNALNHELRKYALRAYSVALEEKTILPTDSQVEPLVAMAENAETDKFQREETYLTLGQINLPQTVTALEKLLKDKDFFWRMVGSRCLLRLDGNTHLTTILRTKRITTDEVETRELIQLIAKFPKLKPAVSTVLQSAHAFSIGVAINVLATIGDKKTITALQKIKSSATRLPKLFSERTVGAAASTAIDAIGKKG